MDEFTTCARRSLRLATLLSLSLSVIALASAPETAWARPPKLSEKGHMGMGVGIGALGYGYSSKFYLQDGRALQGNLGPFFAGDTSRYGRVWSVGADYIFEMAPISSTREIDMIWALGPGIAGGVSNRGTWVADLNLCAGVILQFHELPLDFAIEYRPGVRFKTRGFLDSPGRATPNFTSFGLQLRYYFKRS
jgi:hypothetical protein